MLTISVHSRVLLLIVGRILGRWVQPEKLNELLRSIRGIFLAACYVASCSGFRVFGFRVQGFRV